MSLSDEGDMLKFVANDKCASGTAVPRGDGKGARVRIDELGPLSAKAKSPVPLASTCTVWAQADVIEYLNAGVPVEDIARASTRRWRAGSRCWSTASAYRRTCA